MQGVYRALWMAAPRKKGHRALTISPLVAAAALLLTLLLLPEGPGRPYAVEGTADTAPTLLLRAQHRRVLAPGWGKAFLEAWAALGRPDLRDSPLLPPPRSETRPQAPFSSQELAALEALSSLPLWRERSFSQTFLQARGHLQESAFPDAARRAFQVAEQTVGAGTALLLLRRAESSWALFPLDEQRRLGHLLWLVGQRMAESSSLQEHSVGTLLMELGAGYMEQRCDLSQALDRDETVREGLRHSLKASIERWPLPSLWEELEASRARNELHWLRAFTGRANLP